jgi:hypothetical protein
MTEVLRCIAKMLVELAAAVVLAVMLVRVL